MKPKGKFIWGEFYLLTEIDTARNYTKSFEYFTKAANQKEVKGNYYIARMYKFCIGVKESIPEALKNHNVAAKQRNTAACY